MSIESDAKKWLDNVSRIRALDPQGVFLATAGGYFDWAAAVFENKDFNPEDTKKKLGALRGRLTRLTGKPIAEELGSFINITARYATKTQADFDGFVKALYSPGASPVGSSSRPSSAGSSPRPSPRPSSAGSSPRPSPRPSSAGFSPRPSPRPFPVESSWLDTFASTGSTPRHEPRIHTAENPFAEDEKEEHSTALRVIGVIILLLLAIFLIYNTTGSGKSAILSRYAVESDGGTGNNNGVAGNGNAVVKGTMKDSRDGKIYRTVRIGSQTWMAENLNYSYNRGTARSYCYYDDPKNCAKYGRLYTWSAAMDSAALFSKDGKGCGFGRKCSGSGRRVRGVCPAGWHLPSGEEWDTLKNFIAKSLFNGNTGSVGYALKSTSGWYDNGNGSDAFGFGVLPAGWDYNRGILYSAYFWDSAEGDVNRAYCWFLECNSTSLIASGSFKNRAISVRCIKDYF